MSDSNSIQTPKIDSNKKKPRMGDSITSKVLNHFKEVPANDSSKEPNKSHICNLCQQKYCGSKSWNLVLHIQKCHPNEYQKIAQKDSIKLKRLIFLQNCTEIISVNGRSFSYLYDSGFRAVAKDKLAEFETAGLGINLSNHDLVEVKSHLHETSQLIQTKIRNEIEHRPLSLLADIVTIRNRSICGFSIQYILNGQLKIRSIGMVELLQRKTGKYIAEIIIKRLNEFGIHLKQIVTITTDNGANVLKMVSDINSHLQVEMEPIEPVASESENENANDDEDPDVLIEKLLQEQTEITDDYAIDQVLGEVDFNQENSTLLNEMCTEMLSFGSDIWDITGVNCAEHTFQNAIEDAMEKLDARLRMSCRYVVVLVNSSG